MDSGRDSPDSLAHHQCKKDKATLEAQAPVNGGIPNLPEEIIVEIFARLPVKSLLRFRCVSKSWLTLISSKQFIGTHLNISRQERNLSKYRIMLTISDPTADLKHCPLSSLMHEPSTDACSIDYPKKHPSIPVGVVGSCNGLICLALNRKDLFLWNPCTRKSNKLPPVNVNIEQGLCNVYCSGFYESNDDYKVVAILCESGNAGEYLWVVKIYSLKTNSWKRMKDFRGGDLMDDSAKFASGKLHWSTYSKLSLDERKIVSLDMESEVFGIVEQPDYGEGKLEPILGLLGECICVLCNSAIGADLWVLQEYGVKESWTKVATVPYIDSSWNWNLKPLSMLRNGEILLVLGKHVVVYNPKDNSFRIREISNVEYFHESDIYIESLVSPVANGR